MGLDDCIEIVTHTPCGGPDLVRKPTKVSGLSRLISVAQATIGYQDGAFEGKIEDYESAGWESQMLKVNYLTFSKLWARLVESSNTTVISYYIKEILKSTHLLRCFGWG